MPNILKAPAKVNAARNFLLSFYDAANPDRLFVGLADAGGEWAIPASPDAPIDSFEEEKNFWDNLIGVGQVTKATETELVVPRKDWVSAETYVVFNETADAGSGTFDKANGRDFYVANTESAPKVYYLAAINTGAAGYDGTSTNEPTHKDPTGVEELDGYTWAYLYTLGAGADVGTNILTSTWMPVPSSANAYGNGSNYTQGDIVEGDNSTGFYAGQFYQVAATLGAANGADMASDTNNTWIEWKGDQILGAFFVGCTVTFPDEAGTGNEIPSVSYRQVALLRNPLDVSGFRITDQWKGSGFQNSANLSRGVVMTVDNRGTITRSPGQSETVRLILEF